MPAHRRWLKILAWILAIPVGLILAAFLFIEFLIGWGVENASRKAMSQYEGDRIEALLSVVDCSSCSLVDRNQAVWALGQLRNPRALPVLNRYNTGRPCHHSTSICQYEIAKAIKWTEGNAYIAPQLWRVMLSKERPQSAQLRP